MTALGEPSLRVGFDVSRTKAVLRAGEAFRAELTHLAARFPGGGQRGPLAMELSLDEFLAGIDSLADWPHPDSVEWEEELAELVNGVLDDADRAEEHLRCGPAASPVELDGLDATLGGGWCANLTDFQRRDIARLLSLRHGANFSVPGAGKTRVGLAVYAAMKEAGEARRLLVVCPKSAYESWLSEARQCFNEPPVTQVMARYPGIGAEVILVNYERLDRSLNELAEWLRAVPSMVILDEAHRMKLGTQGTYGSACMALGPISRRRLILTGTPAPNGARDLENLLSFVWPGHGRRVVTQAVAGGDLAHASSVLEAALHAHNEAGAGLAALPAPYPLRQVAGSPP